ncbi:hypothetical protein JCM10296v2_004663 [Rhodotorula toruloides]
MPEPHPVTDTSAARGQATLTDLPPEVLSMVCAEARRQDERWIQNSSKWDWSDVHLGRGARRTLDLPKAKGRRELYEPGEWLGRSLFALSLVCRRIRAAARPFLCETIYEGHIAKPVFRIGALPVSLVNSVSHLSIASGGSAELINAIQAIPLLPSLAKFTLSFGVIYGHNMSAILRLHSDPSTQTSWTLSAVGSPRSRISPLRHLELHSQGRHYDLFSGALGARLGNIPGFFDYWPNLENLTLSSGELGGYVLEQLADTRTCLTSLALSTSRCRISTHYPSFPALRLTW